MLRLVRSLLRLTLMSAGALLLLATCTPLVRWTATRLSMDWTDADGDVLIVPIAAVVDGPKGDAYLEGSTYWRTVAALYALRAGHFQAILLSGAGSAEAVKPFLVASGIPEQMILVENRSTSTRENALFAKPLLAGRPGRFVLLTSDYHMYRAYRCFARAGIPVLTRPVPDVRKRARFPRLRWEGFWLLAEEIGKIGYYRARGWI